MYIILLKLLTCIALIYLILYANNTIYTVTRPAEYYGNTLQYHHRQLVNESFRFMLKMHRYHRSSYIFMRRNIFGLRQFMVLDTYTNSDDPLTVTHVEKIGETIFGNYFMRTGNLSDDDQGKMKQYLGYINEFKVEPLESEKFLYSEL